MTAIGSMNCVSEEDRFLSPKNLPLSSTETEKENCRETATSSQNPEADEKHKRQPRNRLALMFLRKARFGLVGAGYAPPAW